MSDIQIIQADVFGDAVTKLAQLGFFSFFLPFLLSLAVFFGLLRKSKVFGEPEQNVAVNGVVAIVAAFMVWAFPVLAGIDPLVIAGGWSTFFFASLVVFMGILISLLIAGMFLPPDLPARLGERLGSRTFGVILTAGILIGAGLIFASGLINFLIPADFFKNLAALSEIIVAIVFMTLTVAVVYIIAGRQRSGG